MPTATEPKKPRTKPAPDPLRDARRVRDILAEHDADGRTSIIDLALRSIKPTATEPTK